MRRKVLLAAAGAILVAIAVATVSLAGSSADRSPSAASSTDRGGSIPTSRAARPGPRGDRERHRGAHRRHRGMHRLLVGSLAQRLGTEPRELRAALRRTRARTLERAVERGAITEAQGDAITSCVGARATCDREAAREALRALRREAQPSTFATRKRELAADLASELGKSPDEVIAAVRAELETKLRWAVTVGAVTERGRDLALGCFDDPAACDVAALRGEVRFRHRGHGGRHHRR